MYSAVRDLHSRAVAALSDAEAFIYIAPPLEEAPDAVTGSSAAKPEDQTVGQVTATLQKTQVRCKHWFYLVCVVMTCLWIVYQKTLQQEASGKPC